MLWHPDSLPLPTQRRAHVARRRGFRDFRDFKVLGSQVISGIFRDFIVFRVSGVFREFKACRDVMAFRVLGF